MCEYLVFIELVQSLKNSYLGSVADSSRFFILQQSAGVSSAEMSETEMSDTKTCNSISRNRHQELREII